MPDSKLPVIAAIPNYNMAGALAELLPQLLDQGYENIYVLDDVSTDNSREVVAAFAPRVTWVGGKDNLGSGGNRNRILEAHPANCIIHFLDADVRLISKGTAEAACRMMHDPNTGFVGGLVNEHGKQGIWNFGQYPDFRANIAGIWQTLFGRLQAQKPWWRRALRRLMHQHLTTMPDLAITPKRQPIFWTAEANLLIERDRLAELGGFDPQVREHDIMTVAYHARQAGFTMYFDPAIAVEHRLLKVRGYNRKLKRIKTARYLRRKYGFALWF